MANDDKNAAEVIRFHEIMGSIVQFRESHNFEMMSRSFRNGDLPEAAKLLKELDKNTVDRIEQNDRKAMYNAFDVRVQVLETGMVAVPSSATEGNKAIIEKIKEAMQTLGESLKRTGHGQPKRRDSGDKQSSLDNADHFGLAPLTTPVTSAANIGTGKPMA